MNNNLKDIDGLFKNQFEGFHVQPSSSVWNALKFKLWAGSFLKFGLASFNVYYSAIILSTVIAGTTIILNSDSSEINIDNSSKEIIEDRNLNAIEKTENITILNTSTETDLLTRKSDLADQFIDNTPLDKNTLVTKSSENEVINFDLGQGSNEPTIIKSIDLAIEDKIRKESVSTQTSVEVDTGITEKEKTLVELLTKPKETESVNDNPIATDENKNVSDVEKGDVGEDEKNDINDDEVNVIPIVQEESITFFDTVIVYDTIPFYDTISINQIKDNSNSNWSFDFGLEVMNNNFNYNSDDNILADKMNLASTVSVGYGFGGQVNYEVNNWMLQTGLSYLQMTENFSYTKVTTNSNTTEFWNYFPNGTDHIIDTINWQFIFDTEDSSYVFVPIIHETITTLYDSTLITLTDSTTKEEVFNSINKYSYLEIPFSIGYNFYKKDNLSVGARLGGRIGLFIDGNGKTISVDDNVSVINFESDDLPFMMTRINMFLGMPVYFEMKKGMGLIFEPYYRFGLNSMYNKDYTLSAKTGGIGVNIGIRYKF